MNDTESPDIEQAPLAADADSLDAAEGLDAIETEEGCFHEEELDGPDDFMLFYEKSVAKDEEVKKRSNRRNLKKRALRKAAQLRKRPSGSDAERAPVTDETAPEEHDQDATKADRKSKPLSICSQAYAAGISKRGEE